MTDLSKMYSGRSRSMLYTTAQPGITPAMTTQLGD
jgi:hypothetical protein